MKVNVKVDKFFKYLLKGKIYIGGHLYTCPFKTWWKARKYWKRPKFKFYIGRIGYKLTGYYDHDSSIKLSDGKLLYKKGDPIYDQVGVWYFASWNYLKWYKSKFRQKWFPLTIDSFDIGWKDKWNEPRYEMPGTFSIIWGNNIYNSWQICFRVEAPKIECYIPEEDKEFFKEHISVNHERPYSIDDYWETMLWFTEYCDCDFKKAFNSWQNGNWSTSYEDGVDENGKTKYVKFNLGPSWNPSFLTKRGLREMASAIKEKELERTKDEKDL